MLQTIRKNFQGTIAKVIVILIIVPFALFGIESLLGGSSVQYVAEVNGEGISLIELQRRINQQKRQLLLTEGDDIDPALLDDQLLAGPALEALIEQSLLVQVAEDYGLTVADAHLGEFLAAREEFQLDGRFDPDLYRRRLSDRGYSPAGFQQLLRQDSVITQLRAGLAGSEFVTPAEVEQLAMIDAEQRDIRYLLMPLEQFRSDALFDEAQIQDWYETHLERFTLPESVRLKYIELRQEDFHQPVAEQQLQELYQSEQASFQVPAQRRVSHILFEQADGESEAQLQQRMTAVQQRLMPGAETGGESFADLASALSADVGSAGQGGDLGFTTGDSFPPQLETVIATLELNQVSTPVASAAGWHLLKLTAIVPGESRDFAAVRAELEVRVQAEQAALVLLQKVEALRDLVFNADDLAGPAAELELQLQTSAAVTRGQGEGLFGNAGLNAAAFGQEVLNDAYNSEVIEITPQHFVVLRVHEHTPARARPLPDVRAEVQQALREERARREILARADALLASLRAGASIEQVALANGYQWQVELGARRGHRGLPQALLQRAFQLPAPAPGKTSLEYVQNAGGDVELFQLVRVSAAEPASLSEAQRERWQNRLNDEYSYRVDEYYQQQLHSAADIVRN